MKDYPATQKPEDCLMAIFAEQLGRPKEDLGRDAKWADIAESLDWMEIGMRVEDEFLIEIHDEDLMRMVTVGDALDYLVKRIQ